MIDPISLLGPYSLPEHRLVAAMLAQGIRDAVAPKVYQGDGREHRKAIRWVMSDEDSPMTFRWCADALGYDEDTVAEIRRRVLWDAMALRRELMSHRVAAA